MSVDVSTIIEQLKFKQSSKRRSAAKKLRKLRIIEAGPAVLEALQNELMDNRTWETQYQMVMALGDIGYTDSLDFLRSLSAHKFESTMVLVALGDAITFLEHRTGQTQLSLGKWIDDNHRDLSEGGFRALAANRITPDESLIRKAIEFAYPPSDDNMDFWVAVASSGWPVHLTNQFLEDCLVHSNLDETKRAAKFAQSGEFTRYSIL